jgi:hypothetical protein
MKRSIFLTLLSLAPATLCAQQNDPIVAVSTTPPLLLTILLVAGTCACVVFGVQVFFLVRGGQLSTSWLFLVGGFGLLTISQIVILLNGFGVISNIRYLVPILLLIMSGLFIYGLLGIKKVLG